MVQYCNGYLPNNSLNCKEEYGKFWEAFLKNQTLVLSAAGDNTAVEVFSHDLQKEDLARLPHTLLEKMAWALLARPECDVLIQPLHISIASETKKIYDCPTISLLKPIVESGYIAVSRTKGYAHPTLLKNIPNHHINTAVVSHAALDNTQVLSDHCLKIGLTGKLWIKLSAWIRYKIPRPAKIIVRQLINTLKNSTAGPHPDPDGYIPDQNLAKKKSWETAYPEIVVTASPKQIQKRTPILIAVHWLELGGAEKFVVDLVKALPKTEFAIYITTDMPSANTWENEIKGYVEEIFHLPEFLPVHMMKIFYTQYIKTRKIKLLHIHHAPWAYDALFYIRRFFPDLVVMDTLHIIELPPNAGGYPEYVGKKISPLINQHHVISKLLKNFLIQRWQVAQDKIAVIYLNVDTEYFDPNLIENNFLRAKLNIPENAFLVGFIGRFVYQKQPMVFVEMAKNILAKLKQQPITKDIYFIMVGSGPLTHGVKQKAAKYHLDHRLFFHDEVSDTRPIYKDLDLLVMPSANEGLALVAYESMAMKTPVIFSDVGAQSELIEPEYLVPLGGDEASKFADKVLDFVQKPDQEKATNDRLRDYILKHHRAAQTFDQIIALYHKLLKSPGNRSF